MKCQACGYLGYYLTAGIMREKGPDFIHLGPVQVLVDTKIGPKGTAIQLLGCPQCGTVQMENPK